MNRKAVIFGVKGYQLSKKEKSFFKKTKPWGIILFSRNIKNFSQLKCLINDIKKYAQVVVNEVEIAKENVSFKIPKTLH